MLNIHLSIKYLLVLHLAVGVKTVWVKTFGLASSEFTVSCWESGKMNLLSATGGGVTMAGTATWPCGLLSAELWFHLL